MPEALALIAVFAICTAIYLGARWRTRRPAGPESELELARAREHLQWLERRLALARAENWDRDMIARLTEQRALAEHELAGWQRASN